MYSRCCSYLQTSPGLVLRPPSASHSPRRQSWRPRDLNDRVGRQAIVCQRGKRFTSLYTATQLTIAQVIYVLVFVALQQASRGTTVGGTAAGHIIVVHTGPGRCHNTTAGKGRSEQRVVFSLSAQAPHRFSCGSVLVGCTS